MEIEQQPQRDVQQFHVTLQQSWPHDPVHFDGGANDLTGQSVSFGEIRVHGVGLILEQKETKETKNASHRILRHIYQYQFVKVILSPCLGASRSSHRASGPRTMPSTRTLHFRNKRSIPPRRGSGKAWLLVYSFQVPVSSRARLSAPTIVEI